MMKKPDEIKQDIIDCTDEAIVVSETGDAHDLLDFADKAHVCMATALMYIQRLELRYSQVSKALCGKENATLDEVLQAVGQVKTELADAKLNHQHTIDIAEKQKEQIGKLKKLVVRMSKEIAAISAERDAAVIALHGNCEVCRHEESLKCASCIFNEDAWNNPDDNWQWRGVCPENTEVQDDY